MNLITKSNQKYGGEEGEQVLQAIKKYLQIKIVKQIRCFFLENLMSSQRKMSRTQNMNERTLRIPVHTVCNSLSWCDS